jgi:hypothetical protein
MVTACLLAMVVNNDYLSPGRKKSVSLESPIETRNGQFMAEAEESLEESYRNGEYRIILQVVSVLTYGKLAKRLTDKAINMCDHMQNLRRAIFDYKLRLDTIEDQHSKQYKSTREVAFNYLIRYFYLIVFADYLLEELGGKKECLTPDGEEAICDNEMKQDSFSTWLGHRREITNILKLQAIELD